MIGKLIMFHVYEICVYVMCEPRKAVVYTRLGGREREREREGDGGRGSITSCYLTLIVFNLFCIHF